MYIGAPQIPNHLEDGLLVRLIINRGHGKLSSLLRMDFPGWYPGHDDQSRNPFLHFDH
jgi:hypothetical protein